ncbi:hypothetical protein [Stenotrophomonas sp.]|uniref:hypothetical protein n=1 Tax=Stenotrophomonas sp. TaxID=69392 RepID=UPI00031DF03A|nr:hypothetical protein [Stenotrophomonas sp.]
MSIDYLELNAWHKRQATLLYHVASMPYIKGLVERIDALIAFTDGLLEERADLDTAGRALANWRPIDTAGHFSTYAYPALVDFRENVVKSIALRSFEQYRTAGQDQCSRMLDEYAHQMIWASREQEDEFRHLTESVFRYAGLLSDVMYRPSTLDDFSFWSLWQEKKHLFPRIPRFRVRTDVVGVSDQTPPRTGVYVPQEDPMAALQFAWTGGFGELGSTYTLSDFGRLALDRVGRSGLWSNAAGLHALIGEPIHRDLPDIDDVDRANVSLAPSAVSREGFEGHPCKWYFVEMMNDAYEDIDGSYAGTASTAACTRPHRMEAGKRVPQDGWWYTPAQMGSRRYFKKDDRFPELRGSDYGNVLWIWSPDQSGPKL